MQCLRQISDGTQYTKIGVVNVSGEITIDNDNWGYISDWKEAYDTSLEKLLAN